MPTSMTEFLAGRPNSLRYLTGGDPDLWEAAMIGLTGNLADLPEEAADSLFSELRSKFPDAYKAWVDGLRSKGVGGP